jgi:hypothetical protein
MVFLYRSASKLISCLKRTVKEDIEREYAVAHELLDPFGLEIADKKTWKMRLKKDSNLQSLDSE